MIYSAKIGILLVLNVVLFFLYKLWNIIINNVKNKNLKIGKIKWMLNITKCLNKMLGKEFLIIQGFSVSKELIKLVNNNNSRIHDSNFINNLINNNSQIICKGINNNNYSKITDSSIIIIIITTTTTTTTIIIIIIIIMIMIIISIEIIIIDNFIKLTTTIMTFNKILFLIYFCL